MRTAIIIPARLAAQRLPGKALASLGDLPLVVRVARRAQMVDNADLVAVATDSETIATCVTEHGIQALMTRSSHMSGTDRVAEAARALAATHIVNLQCDEPFIDPDDLRALIDVLQRDQDDIITLRAPITDRHELLDPNVVKVVCDDRDRAMYFSRAPIPFDRDSRNHDLPLARKHVGVYAYRRDILQRLCQLPPHPLEICEKLEQLRALACGLTIRLLDAKTAARGIDTPEDLAWARAYLARLGGGCNSNEEVPP